MDVPHNCLISCIEENKVIAENLINKANSLMFSAHMIVSVIPRELETNAAHAGPVTPGLNVKPLNSVDFAALAYELQSLLNNVSSEISTFIPTAENAIARALLIAGNSKSAYETSPFTDRKAALERNISVLRSMISGR